MKKLKVDSAGKGEGNISLESSKDEMSPVLMLVFRNQAKKILFQGQLAKNVSKIYKPKNSNLYKVKRFIMALEKIEKKNMKLVKCIITVIYRGIL